MKFSFCYENHDFLPIDEWIKEGLDIQEMNNLKFLNDSILKKLNECTINLPCIPTIGMEIDLQDFEKDLGLTKDEIYFLGKWEVWLFIKRIKIEPDELYLTLADL